MVSNALEAEAIANTERDSIRQQAQYGGELMLPDGGGDRWVVGGSGSIAMEAVDA